MQQRAARINSGPCRSRGGGGGGGPKKGPPFFWGRWLATIAGHDRGNNRQHLPVEASNVRFQRAQPRVPRG